VGDRWVKVSEEEANVASEPRFREPMAMLVSIAQAPHRHLLGGVCNPFGNERGSSSLTHATTQSTDEADAEPPESNFLSLIPSSSLFFSPLLSFQTDCFSFLFVSSIPHLLLTLKLSVILSFADGMKSIASVYSSGC